MKIIAHRGNDGIHKENTLEAILNSINQENDGVEFDIRITKDYHFVINHDPFYEGYLISKTKLKVLQKKGINTLEEVLEKIDSHKIILIEIKEERKTFNVLVRKLYKLLNKYNLNYYVMSFNYNLIKYFKIKYSSVKTGILIGITTNINKITELFDFYAVYYKHAYKIRNYEVFVWTVNNQEQLSYVQKDQNIITDNHEYFIKYEKR